MATIDILDWNKKKVGSTTLNADVFEAPVRKEVLHTMVRWQLACRRQGTHKAKTRGEVSGTGKKPYKQKGTGNARRGTEKSPLISGGGATFAPRPRDYSYSLNKKLKQMGLKSALSYLVKEGRFHVVKDMTSADGKTKEIVSRLKGFGAEKAVLIGSSEDNFKRATSNLKNFCYYPAEGLNVYDLLKFNTAIVTEESLKKIENRCGVES